MASTSSSSVVKYPFPSEVNVANFVPIKLGGSSNYSLWKKLMLNLIESNELEGFVDGTIKPPPFSLEERMQEECRSWKRSDGLVRGWIFVTVTEKILRQLVLLATARDAWIALEDYSDPSVKKCEDERATMIASQYLPLYKAIRNGDWDRATNFFDRVPNAVRAGITANSETALMLAVRLSNRKIRKDFVEKLMMTLSGMSEEDVARDVARTDKFGQTALHKASESGDIHLANFLVQRNRALPNILDNDGYNPRQLAVHCAARRGNRRMVVYLLEVTNLDGDPNPFEGELGVRLLNNLVNGELYDIASTFLQRYPKLASMEPHSLERVSYQLTSFRSGTRLNFFQRLIYSGIPLKLEGTANRHDVGDVDMHVLLQVEVPAAGVVSPSSYC